ncbi:MAG: hypothetical protein ACI8PB_001333 [Desulforhopalus sp.]|jgi:hypothetical protein
MNQSALAQKAKISLHLQGNRTFSKVSYPVHSGIFSEIETESHVFHFNLNHEIIRLKGKDTSWRHPHEWLKRTVGDDWVYTSTGGYTGVFEATGEYYLPNFKYPSNNILGGRPFSSPEINDLTLNWHSILESIAEWGSYDTESSNFLKLALQNNPQCLRTKAEAFHTLTGGHISVLPPDARHVDYQLIPINISRGCLYKCKFCKVKNRYPFKELDYQDIDSQTSGMKDILGADLINYNSIYLGEHDALLSSPETILSSIKKAYNDLGLYNSYLNSVNCFFFGSATSLMQAPEQLFTDLNHLQSKTYINIGLESPDQSTLDQLGKPISAALVWESFKRIQDINRTYSNIEISANFIMDDTLPSGHYKQVEKLIRDTQTYQQAKGTIYFSPLTFDEPSRAKLFQFNRLKIMSRFPTFLYIIRRL